LLTIDNSQYIMLVINNNLRKKAYEENNKY
jgi:hypothetical protein